jgi:hypothetical protein
MIGKCSKNNLIFSIAAASLSDQYTISLTPRLGM